LLVPIYTRVLSQQDYGNLDLVFTAGGLLKCSLTCQQAQGFMAVLPEHSAEGTRSASLEAIS